MRPDHSFIKRIERRALINVGSANATVSMSDYWIRAMARAGSAFPARIASENALPNCHGL